MPEPGDGRRKPRPGVEAQRSIIADAAADLFMARGTRAVSISDICRHADISRPTFYRCFADKPALVAHLYQQAIDEPIQQLVLRRLPAHGADRAWMRAAVEAVFAAIFARHRQAMWLYTEASDRTSLAHAIIDRAFEDAAALLEGWLFADRPVPPEIRTVLKAVMAACQWIAREAIASGLTEQDRDNASRAAWVLIEGVLDRLEL